MMDDSDDIRLDKWLWAARFFKTRSLIDWIGSAPLSGQSVKTIAPIDRNATAMTDGATEVTA